MIEVLLVAAALTGKPGTQISTDMSICPPRVYGCADIPGNVIYMQGDKLVYLERIARGQYVQPYLGALALIVFCHEARHVRGTLDERVADRWAYWHAPVVARLLGASKGWTARMRVWIPQWWRMTH